MRTYPKSKYDMEDVERLRAPEWMVELLKLNPEYVFWGPNEDCMCVGGRGWMSEIFVDSWSEFDIHLNELNEVVHWYFRIDRDEVRCGTCGGSGYNPETLFGSFNCDKCDKCDKCDGHGYVYTAPEPRLALVLWLIHPRKGASRGVEVKRVEQDQLGEVYNFLATAAQRNAARFESVAKLAEKVER